jgi:S-(hydroxymethyl)glutathione dehydrogenase/alcohol dehydrogenase
VKAAVCHQFGQPLVVEQLEIRSATGREVKIRVGACAICHSDIHYLDGAWGGDLPAVYGHEAAGEVVEAGPEVSDVAIGDRVVVTLLRACGQCFHCVTDEPYLCEGEFSLDQDPVLRGDIPITQGLRTGAFAEFVLVDQSQVVRIPSSTPLDTASLLACGVLTGVGAVTRTAQIPPGSRVAVIGAGGVGLNSIQGAVLAGAEVVVALDVTDQKLKTAREFGATHAADATTSDAVDAIRAATEGRGADYVFVTVGSGAAIEQGLASLRPGGTLVLVGMPASSVTAAIAAADFAGKSQRILGSKMGSARIRKDIPMLLALYQQGRLKLDELISGRFSLDQINEAIASSRAGQALRNVVMF